MKYLDIHSKSNHPVARSLSNFTSRSFIFDGWECSSIEGPLQAVKTSFVMVQERICKMSPAKSHELYKKAHDKDWQRVQRLNWQGVKMSRLSRGYHLWVTRLFDAVFEQDGSFVEALIASKEYELEHTIGKFDPAKTVLTEIEFIGQLNRLRAQL